VEFNLIVEYLNYINQAYCFYVQYFIDGRKVECVESMVFDARGQAKEGGMQVLQQCYFIPQVYNPFPFGLSI
jgi:hypothetical protein